MIGSLLYHPELDTAMVKFYNQWSNGPLILRQQMMWDPLPPSFSLSAHSAKSFFYPGRKNGVVILPAILLDSYYLLPSTTFTEFSVIGLSYTHSYRHSTTSWSCWGSSIITVGIPAQKPDGIHTPTTAKTKENFTAKFCGSRTIDRYLLLQTMNCLFVFL